MCAPKRTAPSPPVDKSGQLVHPAKPTGDSKEGDQDKDEPEPADEAEECLKAVGAAAADGFIDPLAAVAGIGKGMYEARERIGKGDYGPRRDGARFPRTWGSAARIALRRFIPGYVQTGLIVGTVKGTMEFISNKKCRLKK